jgi:hypothetical protein
LLSIQRTTSLHLSNGLFSNMVTVCITVNRYSAHLFIWSSSGSSSNHDNAYLYTNLKQQHLQNVNVITLQCYWATNYFLTDFLPYSNHFISISTFNHSMQGKSIATFITNARLQTAISDTVNNTHVKNIAIIKHNTKMY